MRPTHAARPIGCWAPAKENLAIEQTSGRQRLNVHGALDLETGKTAMIDVETVDAASSHSHNDHADVVMERGVAPERAHLGEQLLDCRLW